MREDYWEVICGDENAEVVADLVDVFGDPNATGGVAESARTGLVDKVS